MMKILKENGLQLGPKTLLHFGVGASGCECCRGVFRLSLIRATPNDAGMADADINIEQMKDLRNLVDRLISEAEAIPAQFEEK